MFFATIFTKYATATSVTCGRWETFKELDGEIYGKDCSYCSELTRDQMIHLVKTVKTNNEWQISYRKVNTKIGSYDNSFNAIGPMMEEVRTRVGNGTNEKITVDKKHESTSKHTVTN